MTNRRPSVTSPQRETLLTLSWLGGVPLDEVIRLSRSWAATISEKPVVAEVHLQVITKPGETLSRDQRKYREIDKQKHHVGREPTTRTRCAVCGRRTHPGERWCKGTDAEGYECCVDLFDPENLIKETF